ncbi:MAG: ATP-binding protein, partial [Actinobacteria bacterium]|nr:ATP-binding protein [Actinomycetota bacterium]
MTTQGELFTRHATPLLFDYLQHFRAVIINGPRQSGKSTLMSQILPTVGGTLRTLDDLGERQSA